MALFLLYLGLAWSDVGFGKDKLDPCQEVYQAPLRKEDRPRIIQAHFGQFSHSHSLEPYALDLVASPGATVRAMKRGKVIQVVDHFQRGKPQREFLTKANYIILEHANNIYTLYSHLEHSSSRVSAGDWVNVGEPIAKVGCSGFCEADHLHIEGFVREGNLRRSYPIAIANAQGVPQRYFEAGEELFSRCEN